MGRILDQVLGHRDVISGVLDSLERSRLAPTLLFVGPEGVGKRKVALGLAQALVCETSRRACGMCGSCLRIEKLSSESLLFVEPQGAQIKIEQTREIQNWLSLRSIGRARVVLINEADKLNPQSSNSLLKILEEPPVDTYFFLIAPSRSSVLPTIRSRSQVLRFGTLAEEDLAQLSKAPLWVLASAQGQASRVMLLSQPELDELRKRTFEVFASATSDNLSWAFGQLKELAEDREKALQIVGFWQQFVRDLFYFHRKLQPLIHRDFDYSKVKTDDAVLETLSLSSIRAEKEIVANSDRMLVLENLWKRLHDEVAL